MVFVNLTIIPFYEKRTSFVEMFSFRFLSTFHNIIMKKSLIYFVPILDFKTIISSSLFEYNSLFILIDADPPEAFTI